MGGFSKVNTTGLAKAGGATAGAAGLDAFGGAGRAIPKLPSLGAFGGAGPAPSVLNGLGGMGGMGGMTPTPPRTAPPPSTAAASSTGSLLKGLDLSPGRSKGAEMMNVHKVQAQTKRDTLERSVGKPAPKGGRTRSAQR